MVRKNPRRPFEAARLGAMPGGDQRAVEELESDVSEFEFEFVESAAPEEESLEEGLPDAPEEFSMPEVPALLPEALLPEALLPPVAP